MITKQQTQTQAAIYLRLSRDDGGDAESNSIGNQREMLRKYAKEHRLLIFDEYVDDGISGTTFERPSFKRMIADIKAKKVGTVICKDLSRLGRNNAMVAYYTEIFFIDHNVRFIAINDGIDFAKGENEIMGFKSIINEYYAKDISKKVRSSLRTIAEKGFFTGAHAPYGYLIDPDNKHHLIPDEATMPIVKEMFTLAAEGVSCRQIAIQFTERGIQTPREYLARTTGLFKKYLETLQEWATNSVANMLKSEVYIGSITSQKTTTKSFKNVQKVYKPKSEWVVVPNCHEPIVDKETFDLAQSLIRRRKRTPAEVNPNIFSGLVKCSSCGSGLSYSGACRNRSIAIFICNLYRSKSRKNLCTSHYISYNDLYKAVLSQVQKLTAFVEEHEGEFEAFYNQYLHDNANNNETTKQRELAKLQKRNVEVDTIIKGLFEQNFLGTLTSKRLAVLVADYETEQAKLQERIEEIEKSLSGERNALLDAGYFFKAISKYKDITELNPVLLHELIEKICVHHATGAGYGRKQRVDIYWKFIGLLDDKRH